MVQSFPAVVATVLVIVTGLATGLWTGRWKTSDQLEQAAVGLQKLPMAIGDWRATPKEIDAKEVQLARMSGYVMRVYRHRLSGAEVTVLLMCGRPGPIAVHTPDICFKGAGYELTAPAVKYMVKDGTQDAEMFMGNFRDPDSQATGHICVLWSWSTAGKWEATDYPRLHFASAPVLYKLYVLCNLPSSGRFDEGPRAAFLPSLLREIGRTVFSHS